MTQYRKIIAGLTMGLAAVTVSPAVAQNSVSVPTGHLDLSNTAGQKALDNLLESAVREVCGSRPASRDLSQVLAHRECVTDARASFKSEREFAISNARGGERMAVGEKTTSRTEG